MGEGWWGPMGSWNQLWPICFPILTVIAVWSSVILLVSYFLDLLPWWTVLLETHARRLIETTYPNHVCWMTTAPHIAWSENSNPLLVHRRGVSRSTSRGGWMLCSAWSWNMGYGFVQKLSISISPIFQRITTNHLFPSWNSLEYGKFVAFPIFGQTHILDEVVIEMSKRMISLSRRPLFLPQDVIACWLTAPSKGTTATW